MPAPHGWVGSQSVWHFESLTPSPLSWKKMQSASDAAGARVVRAVAAERRRARLLAERERRGLRDARLLGDARAREAARAVGAVRLARRDARARVGGARRQDHAPALRRARALRVVLAAGAAHGSAAADVRADLGRRAVGLRGSQVFSGTAPSLVAPSPLEPLEPLVPPSPPLVPVSAKPLEPLEPPSSPPPPESLDEHATTSAHAPSAVPTKRPTDRA